MAWQYPQHACGHAGERYQAYGPNDNRRRQLAALESHDCPSCRRAKADAQAQESGLPTLQGSDKQVAWAAQIRERALRMRPEMAAKLSPETSAKWWIDSREVL